MASSSPRLHALGAPLLWLLFTFISLMALGSAAPPFENWHPLRQMSSLTRPDPAPLPFQGRGQIQVLAPAMLRWKPVGYLGYHGEWVDGSVREAIGVFDGRRSGSGKGKETTVALRTTRHAPCGVARAPTPPVMACTPMLGPDPSPIGPIFHDRIRAWAVYSPVEASAKIPPQMPLITFAPLPISDHVLQLKWVPVG
ncbi:MAG: hypothetical protein M1826_007168 [Phylliscum demangeonii]|nr:MAG: hypothetical protein M1826_007168 [Phylliscum demangeonii]